MYVIVGLGNPGSSYQDTRHNIGFMVLDEICRKNKLKSIRDVGPSQSVSYTCSGHPVMLVRPLTYMNLSGRAVKRFVDKNNISDYSKVLIVCDDINLPFGVLRLRSSGSAGGQKGLVSIIRELGTQEFPRLRVGIGDTFRDAAEYVLSPFTKKEKSDLPFIIHAAVEAIETFITEGTLTAMSIHNKNVLDH